LLQNLGCGCAHAANLSVAVPVINSEICRASPRLPDSPLAPPFDTQPKQVSAP
jgi:hypothetical protein